ncbi:MAG: FhaA domain-containing protein [Solirubrobacterales bacterium]
MSFLKNFESRLEKLIEGGFKSAFKSEVQPVELARKLSREMDAHRAASVSRTYAPNDFTVYLSPADREHFSQFEEGLKRELSLELLEHARKRGYSLLSRPTVTIETDDRLELGLFGIQARLADVPEAEIAALQQPESGHTMVYNARDLQAPARDLAEPARGAAPRAVLETGDRRFALTPPSTIVGRGSDADIKLDDPNISRTHVQFRVDGVSWTVSDMGSTNGTRLSGRQLTASTELRSGDVIELGNSVLTFVLE